MKNFLVLTICSILIYGCQSDDQKNPQWIVDQAIEKAGGSRFLTTTIEFDFRDRHYIAKRNGGAYSYQRILIDSANVSYHDFLGNDGFVRKINGETTSLPDSISAAYARSTNSVIYFALLPYGLNDAAVKKEFLGEATINNQPYAKIKITFGEEGGGEDHEDTFLYWIHKQNFTVDYFGYSYNTDGGGIRFREAINPRYVEGILFQDYINYKPKDESVHVSELETLYISGQLDELSRIELKNIAVQPGIPEGL